MCWWPEYVLSLLDSRPVSYEVCAGSLAPCHLPGSGTQMARGNKFLKSEPEARKMDS